MLKEWFQMIPIIISNGQVGVRGGQNRYWTQNIQTKGLPRLTMTNQLQRYASLDNSKQQCKDCGAGVEASNPSIRIKFSSNMPRSLSRGLAANKSTKPLVQHKFGLSV